MEWNPTWEDPLTSYVKQFAGLIGDQRTRKTFGEIVKGIIGAGSLICQQIAGQSAELSKGKKGSQRVIRLATTGASTKRLREVAVEQLAQAPEEELWLNADSSELRKPSAEAMPYLMQVRDLDEQLVPGYRTQSADWADAWAARLALSSALEQSGARAGNSRSTSCCASTTPSGKWRFKIGRESGMRETSRKPRRTCVGWRVSKRPWKSSVASECDPHL